ncbi:hypothetical protein C0389_03525 [bacterium]|nr:hypothetical protein [bacterium]
MSPSKNFLINGVGRKTKFQSAAKIILDQKLERVLKEIEKFTKNDSIKNLHSLRIAFRKFRYLLETFSGCFGQKLFNHVNRRVQKNQDLLGESRDLDVFELKLKNYQKELDLVVPESIFSRIDEEKILQRQVIKTELSKFTSDKDVNSFFIKSRKSEK